MICNTGAEPCPLPPDEASYAGQTRIVPLPLPRLPSMSDSYAGVPENGFCP